ncbi:GDSL esterase/lipase At5g03820-like [Cryptomeria japonica]|uniref:GDSL esterase/lipase At5g03820-like n=1 Tax=Cryptomeria japonica TaxID=3369 RepID=UPI0027DA6E4B|nr:GDSL esterase/lipase At5g03820-like [Cryptomeria japonica]
MEEDYIAFSISVLTLFLLTLYVSEAEGQRQPLVSALYVFGDSTIDPGNNNFLETIVKSDFPPYGRDFPYGQPTGRFTNGRLITDQLYLLPASLDPEFQGQKLMTGASFGSSASGYVDSTSTPLNVLPLERQVKNFKHYKVRLAEEFGYETTNRTIAQALFAISGGTNDFANNYFTSPLTRKKYTVEQFQDLLLESLTVFIQVKVFSYMTTVSFHIFKILRCINLVLCDQNVYSEGATTVAIVGLPPFGCLPSQITLHNIVENTCVEEFNEVASSFNAKIKALVEKMRPNFPRALIAYLDIYDKLLDIIKSPTKYGFEEPRKGCCGTGLLEAAISCNPSTISCLNPSKYVFWDSFHPTTECYQIIANDLFQQYLAFFNSSMPRS